MDAGDVDAAYQLISRQVETLDSTITTKRTQVANMDKLRGNLLAQEGKLSRLERAGTSVEEFRERVDRVKQLIDESNHEEAERELVSMDQDINELFAALSCLGIEVASMRNKANRLEEMCVSLLS